LRAETRFRRSLGVSGYERQIAGLLLAAGYEVVHQLPVGPYNIDLALPACSIAVEVNGGYWHAYGRHLARRNRRLKQIFDEGWSCCEIWVGHDGLDLGGLGQHLVGCAWFSSPGRVIVGKDHPGSVYCERSTDDFTRVNRRLRQRSPKQFFSDDETVAGVQEQGRKDLERTVAQPELQKPGDLGRIRQGIASGQFVCQGSPGQFERSPQ
jgi:hypothetical protein